ncbi:hypothetical protein B0H13DRAFT_2090166 [Mycena leptocephala]|nr:hypothetical protein B0H13DRAFT_2090166 [Mycena leptocephala]
MLPGMPIWLQLCTMICGNTYPIHRVLRGARGAKTIFFLIPQKYLFFNGYWDIQMKLVLYISLLTPTSRTILLCT